MKKDTVVGFPELNLTEEVATRPVPLHEVPMQARFDREMVVINKHHRRIGKSIDVFWGHANCVEYLRTLVMSGGDGYSHAKAGFRPEVLTAMINLATLHEELFPNARPPAKKEIPGAVF
jgi:hypothetical protein